MKLLWITTYCSSNFDAMFSVYSIKCPKFLFISLTDQSVRRVEIWNTRCMYLCNVDDKMKLPVILRICLKIALIFWYTNPKGLLNINGQADAKNVLGLLFVIWGLGFRNSPINKNKKETDIKKDAKFSYCVKIGANESKTA